MNANNSPQVILVNAPPSTGGLESAVHNAPHIQADGHTIVFPSALALSANLSSTGGVNATTAFRFFLNRRKHLLASGTTNITFADYNAKQETADAALSRLPIHARAPISALHTFKRDWLSIARLLAYAPEEVVRAIPLPVELKTDALRKSCRDFVDLYDALLAERGLTDSNRLFQALFSDSARLERTCLILHDAHLLDVFHLALFGYLTDNEGNTLIANFDIAGWHASRRAGTVADWLLSSQRPQQRFALYHPVVMNPGVALSVSKTYAHYLHAFAPIYANQPQGSPILVRSVRDENERFHRLQERVLQFVNNRLPVAITAKDESTLSALGEVLAAAGVRWHLIGQHSIAHQAVVALIQLAYSALPTQQAHRLSTLLKLNPDPSVLSEPMVSPMLFRSFALGQAHPHLVQLFDRWMHSVSFGSPAQKLRHTITLLKDLVVSSPALADGLDAVERFFHAHYDRFNQIADPELFLETLEGVDVLSAQVSLLPHGAYPHRTFAGLIVYDASSDGWGMKAHEVAWGVESFMFKPFYHTLHRAAHIEMYLPVGKSPLPFLRHIAGGVQTDARVNLSFPIYDARFSPMQRSLRARPSG